MITTEELYDAYVDWKECEKKKNHKKDAFFRWATDQVQENEPATIIVTVEATTAGEASYKAEEENPRMVQDEVRTIKEGETYEVLLKENPEFRDFTYIDPDLKQVFTKKVVAGSTRLDDETLKADDPGFYEEITVLPTERVMKPLEDLTPEQLAKLQEYLSEGKPTVKLLAPRKAKAEELAELE